MPDQEADLFPALLAAALYSHRQAQTLPYGRLEGLACAPKTPLDFAHEDLPDIDDDDTPAVSPITSMGLAA